MHIPDGYLSPATCAVGYAVAIPVWVVAAKRVRRTVTTRNVPTLAVFAAVCFLVMMFNVPIPDGTTAHAVGGALVAIVLGPWAAVIAVSVALLFQALLFGDGGVLSYGVNVVNMAVILPFVGYGVYKLIAGRCSLTSNRRVVAAGIGGYVGLNAAALATALELGIQPDLFHTANGTPLYAPYHFAQSIPAMMLAHLSVAGWVEAVLCGGVIAYLQRANIPLLRVNHPDVPLSDEEAAAQSPTKLRPGLIAGAAVALMVVLTPIGLLAPGGAFGEDAPEDLDLGKYGLSAVPDGLNKYAGYWHHTLFDGYSFQNDAHPVIGYLVSAVVGIVVVGIGVFALAWAIKALTRNRGGSTAGHDDSRVMSA